jgi:hypothetical protein
LRSRSAPFHTIFRSFVIGRQHKCSFWRSTVTEISPIGLTLLCALGNITDDSDHMLGATRWRWLSVTSTPKWLCCAACQKRTPLIRSWVDSLTVCYGLSVSELVVMKTALACVRVAFWARETLFLALTSAILLQVWCVNAPTASHTSRKLVGLARRFFTSWATLPTLHIYRWAPHVGVDHRRCRSKKACLALFIGQCSLPGLCRKQPLQRN